MPSDASPPQCSGTGHVHLSGRLYKDRPERLKPALFCVRLRISCRRLGDKVAQTKFAHKKMTLNKSVVPKTLPLYTRTQ